MKNNIYITGIHSPEDIVIELDKYIIGQHEAKKLVAISLRNRYRRMNISGNMRDYIIPKNILMVGPTGVGKTEIARRISIMYEAPFIKVEATRFTEVGYVGKDVESIIKDLVDIAIKTEKKRKRKSMLNIAEDKTCALVIKNLLNSKDKYDDIIENNKTYEIIKKKLKNGLFDNKEIEIEINKNKFGVDIMSPPGMEDITKQLQGFMNNISSSPKTKKKVKVKEALKIIKEDILENLINELDIKSIVKNNVENYGIVFIDEIDKLTQISHVNRGKGEISREGVQRDLLPLIEGSEVNTKIGKIKTDNILFFASGAFHFSKPTDLIPELQGRLPVQIYLKSLQIEDLMRILVEPKTSIIKQHQALLEIESINLKYEKNAIKRIAELSFDINFKTENLGARRLHSIIEYLLEDISFNAIKLKNQTILITKNYVEKKLGKWVEEQKLDDFIL